VRVFGGAGSFSGMSMSVVMGLNIGYQGSEIPKFSRLFSMFVGPVGRNRGRRREPPPAARLRARAQA
jgi:hypothetical protein